MSHSIQRSRAKQSCAAILGGLLLAACGPGTPGPKPPPTAGEPTHAAPANPTGDCVAPDDGSRAGYHNADGLPWLMDCDPVLRREYWRVFYIPDSGRAAMIPRPDGDPLVRDLCDVGDAFSHVLTSYTLCDEQPDVETVNAMKPSDALALAHALHRKLRFVARETEVHPFAVPSDIADGCDLDPALSTGVLKKVCADAKNPGGEEIARVFSPAEAITVADLLNRLYGIDTD